VIAILAKIRARHILLAMALTYGPLYLADYFCGQCISSYRPYWPFQ